jgi:hypothetical protein
MTHVLKIFSHFNPVTCDHVHLGVDMVYQKYFMFYLAFFYYKFYKMDIAVINLHYSDEIFIIDEEIPE